MGRDSNLVILYFDGLNHDKIGILSHDRRAEALTCGISGHRSRTWHTVHLDRTGVSAGARGERSRPVLSWAGRFPLCAALVAKRHLLARRSGQDPGGQGRTGSAGFWSGGVRNFGIVLQPEIDTGCNLGEAADDLASRSDRSDIPASREESSCLTRRSSSSPGRRPGGTTEDRRATHSSPAIPAADGSSSWPRCATPRPRRPGADP